MEDRDVVEFGDVPLDMLNGVMNDLIYWLNLEIVRYRTYNGTEYHLQKREEEK